MPAATAAMPATATMRTIPHAPAKAEYEGQKRHNAKRRFFHNPNMVARCGGNTEEFCLK
jgi:hypothetical protein